MFEVIGCLYTRHDTGLLIIALVACTFGCATARAMIVRGRSATGRARIFWSLGAGLVAVAAVWTTHFISMLAYQPGVPIRYDLALTVLSAVIALAFPVLAAAISFTRAGGAVAGITFGAGVAAMHYVGLAATDMPAIEIWNWGVVAGSVVITLAVAGLAGHVSLMQPTWTTNISSTTLRIITILIAHFASMGALTVVPTAKSLSTHNISISPTTVSLLVMAATAFIIAQALVVVVIDRHLKSKSERNAAEMRAYIAELESTKTKLEKASEDAKAASKSKSAFLASMSHELRTPLNAILGFSEMVLNEPFGPVGHAKYKEYLGNVHDSGKHLLALINDILDIAHSDAGHTEMEEAVFDPVTKVADVVRLMSGQANKAGVTLVTDLPTALPFLNGDRRRIRQILLNLVSNAIKFTGPGGRVTIKAWVDSEFNFQVRDTGIGMAQQDFSKALEPFGQVDSSLARKYEGTGLGLPLSRQMAELHGGSLNLDSRPGIGTTVTVSIPQWRIVKFEEDNAA